MDDLTSEFLVETNESLEELDGDFVLLEQNPEDKEIIGNIFRVMHTIKGTCGFLGLSRLEKVAHAAENIMDKIRDEAFGVTPPIVSLILEANDKIKELVDYLETNGQEPEGEDQELIDRLNACAESGEVGGATASAAGAEDTVIDEVSSDLKTPDLDEEIDFEPIMAPGAEGDSAGDISSDLKTPDLDEEIDFEPIMAPGAEGAATEPAKEEAPAPVVQNEIKAADKTEAVKKGLEATKKVQSAKQTPAAAQTIRVNLDVLEDLMQMVGELVLTRNQLLQMTRNNKEMDSELDVPMQRLNQITSELQEGVMATRMQPIGNAWAKFPRLVRDLALDLNKKIELKMIGAETDLDRQMLEAIKDPLTHMVRNSADHGVETPDIRAAAGKPEQGTITLSAYHEGGHIIIKITDDGKGLDLERIKEKAIENGVATAEEIAQLSDKKIYQFIFAAGFSTAEKVTEVSGRGVGMDVVVSNIERIGGHVEIDSWPGKGSEFSIQLPLTLAIMPVLIIECAGETFAIPQIRVAEIVRGEFRDESEDAEDGGERYYIETLNGSPVLRLRGQLLPLISLSKTLKLSREQAADNDNPIIEGESEPVDELPTKSDIAIGGKKTVSPEKAQAISEEPFIVVCEQGAQTFGVMVDRVFHTEEIVVKPISSFMKELEVYSGCTILGDGSVIMIIDPNGVIKLSGARPVDETKSETTEDLRKADAIESFLVFKAWQKAPYAVPLELVSRLEELDMGKVELSGGQNVIQYRDKLMRLVTLDDKPLPTEGTQDVVVFTDEGNILGVVVEEISDIVRSEMNIKSQSSKPGFLGSLVINNVTTDLVDISHIFSNTFNSWLTQTQIESDVETADSVSKNVLLVDDSPFFRKFMSPVLAVEGFHVTTASSAKEAIEILEKRAKDFSLILSDIDMPEMNGLEFTAHVKGQPSMQDIPVIALTSHSQEKLMSVNEDPGFSGFVSKSERDSLVEEILKVLSLKPTEDGSTNSAIG